MRKWGNITKISWSEFCNELVEQGSLLLHLYFHQVNELHVPWGLQTLHHEEIAEGVDVGEATLGVVVVGRAGLGELTSAGDLFVGLGGAGSGEGWGFLGHRTYN